MLFSKDTFPSQSVLYVYSAIAALCAGIAVFAAYAHEGTSTIGEVVNNIRADFILIVSITISLSFGIYLFLAFLDINGNAAWKKIGESSINDY